MLGRPHPLAPGAPCHPPARGSRLRSRFGAMRERLVRRYTRQIVDGLVYLHDHGVAHRCAGPRHPQLAGRSSQRGRRLSGTSRALTFSWPRTERSSWRTLALPSTCRSRRPCTRRRRHSPPPCPRARLTHAGLRLWWVAAPCAPPPPPRSARGAVGTPNWMAPEATRAAPAPSVPGDSRSPRLGAAASRSQPRVARSTADWMKADVWSTACTVIEMVTGKAPWVRNQTLHGPRSGKRLVLTPPRPSPTQPQLSNPITVLFHIAYSSETPAVPESLSPEGKAFLRRCGAQWNDPPPPPPRMPLRHSRAVTRPRPPAASNGIPTCAPRPASCCATRFWTPPPLAARKGAEVGSATTGTARGLTQSGQLWLPAAVAEATGRTARGGVYPGSPRAETTSPRRRSGTEARRNVRPAASPPCATRVPLFSPRKATRSGRPAAGAIATTAAAGGGTTAGRLGRVTVQEGMTRRRTQRAPLAPLACRRARAGGRCWCPCKSEAALARPEGRRWRRRAEPRAWLSRGRGSEGGRRPLRVPCSTAARLARRAAHAGRRSRLFPERT